MNRAAPKRPLHRGPPSNVYRRTDQQRSGPQPINSKPPRRGNEAGNSNKTLQRSDCAIKEQCGACLFVNTTYGIGLQQKYHAGLAFLKKAGIVEKARLLPPVAAPKPLEYRSLFKLAVRAKRPESKRSSTPNATTSEIADRFAIGLFQPGTHTIVPMDQCPLHTFPLQRLVRDLKDAFNHTLLTPYDERTHTGLVRFVAARAAHLTGEIILTFVVHADAANEEHFSEKSEFKRLVDALRRLGHKINSAHLNFNAERGNAIFGAKTVRIAGADRLRERLCDLDFEVGPTSFFQVNPWQAINLYRRVEQVAGLSAQSDAVAWDLYCGTGQISLLLARAGYRVLGIEENPEAVLDAAANAQKNKLSNRATFLASRVEDSQTQLPRWAQAPSLIVVNPSRRGLAESTRAHLTQILAQNSTCRFIYVSCEAETLARDLKDLNESGFTVRQVEAFDMFPQTNNMEWLVVLTK